MFSAGGGAGDYENNTGIFSPAGGGFSEKENKLLSFITQETVDVDTLIARSGLTAQEVQSGLLVLALGGAIRQMPEKYFCVRSRLI